MSAFMVQRTGSPEMERPSGKTYMEGIFARDECGKDICLMIEKIHFSLDHTSGKKVSK
jgi:hypothetical protein